MLGMVFQGSCRHAFFFARAHECGELACIRLAQFVGEFPSGDGIKVIGTCSEEVLVLRREREVACVHLSDYVYF